MVALFSAVLSRTCKECLRSQSATLTEERLVCTIVGGARTVTFDVIASQKFVAGLKLIFAVQVPGQYMLVLIEEL